MKLPVDHRSKWGHLFHITTPVAAASIIKDRKLLCSKSTHGTTFAVWAAGTFNDALTHALTAKRHHADYQACDYMAYCFTIRSGTPQRRLLRQRKQGYCTSTPYDGETGQDAEVDCENVTYEEINLLEFFTKGQFVHCANGEYVV